MKLRACLTSPSLLPQDPSTSLDRQARVGLFDLARVPSRPRLIYNKSPLLSTCCVLAVLHVLSSLFLSFRLPFIEIFQKDRGAQNSIINPHVPIPQHQ